VRAGYRVLLCVCTVGCADAMLTAKSIAATHASTTQARERKRSRVATRGARLSTFPSLAAFLRQLKEEAHSFGPRPRRAPQIATMRTSFSRSKMR
jgi:hypothetical protein